MERFYVYTHAKQDTGEVFYIGKGEARRHLSRCGRSEWWKRTVAKHGLNSMIIERFADEADAFAMERYLIASYRAMGVALINMTDGGEGASGRSVSAEHRRRISEAQKMRPRDPAQGLAHSAMLIGRKHSEETKRKIGLKSRGRILSDGHKKSISDAQAGSVKLPETIAKMRLAAQARWDTRTSCVTRRSRAISCVETGAVYDSYGDAIRWLRSVGWPRAKTSGLCDGIKRSTRHAYGYHWEEIN